jgi:hypothetical protein
MKRELLEIFFMMMLLSSTAAVLPVVGMVENTLHEAYIYDIEWAKTYGGNEFDMFHCVHQTDDEGFIVSGITEVSDSYYPLLLKLDPVGDEEWRWTIQQISYENMVFDIREVYPIFTDQVSDGGYLFCLWLDITYEEVLQTIAGLFKFNAQGEQEWMTFHSQGFEWVFRPISFVEVEDGFAVAGTSGPPASYMGDEAGFLKIDTMGDEQWYKEYDYGDPDNTDNRMEAVCRTTDGGYLLAGWGSDSSYDYWMIKTDASGDMEWDATFGGSGDDYGHTKQCYQTNDGGYVIGGFSNSVGAGKFDMWIIKTDSTGHMVWDTTYGCTKNDVCWGLESVDDGGYVAVVTMNYAGFSGDKDDIHLVKMDGNGHIEWVQEYGGPDIQLGGAVDGTTDGGFIVCGCTGPFYHPNSDGLLVKFAPFENQRPNTPERPSGPNNGDPGTEYTFTTVANDPDGDTIACYRWDWGDGNFSEWLDTNEGSYIWSEEGRYNIRVMVKDEHGGESDWSDPLSFSTPKKRMTYSSLFRFLDNNPCLFPFLQLILNISNNTLGEII